MKSKVVIFQSEINNTFFCLSYPSHCVTDYSFTLTCSHFLISLYICNDSTSPNLTVSSGERTSLSTVRIYLTSCHQTKHWTLVFFMFFPSVLCFSLFIDQFPCYLFALLSTLKLHDSPIKDLQMALLYKTPHAEAISLTHWSLAVLLRSYILLFNLNDCSLQANERL